MIGLNREWSPTHKLKCPRWSPTDRCREQKNREEFCQKAVKIISNLRKPLVFFGCGNKSCPGIKFVLKIGRKSIFEDGKANLEVRRWGVAAVSNLHWRCQGQELPGTPRKALFFGNGALWKAQGGVL